MNKNRQKRLAAKRNVNEGDEVSESLMDSAGESL